MQQPVVALFLLIMKQSPISERLNSVQSKSLCGTVKCYHICSAICPILLKIEVAIWKSVRLFLTYNSRDEEIWLSSDMLYIIPYNTQITLFNPKSTPAAVHVIGDEAFN